MRWFPPVSIALLVVSGHTLGAADEDPRALARAVLKQLVEIDTTDVRGNTTTAAEAMAARLRDAGFPADDVKVLGPEARHGNLVARFRGTGARKPILLLSHLDVVDARREDWSAWLEPFRFIEKDGYYYGRGTTDIKDGGAILVANLIRLKREGFRPDRDLILALTAGEEGGHWNGVRFLLGHHRALVDAAYCVNTDGGDFQTKDGRRRLAAMQASEKLSVHFQLEVRDPGGHSSLPRPDNPIYHLSAALSRLSAFEFPVELNEVTRVFFTRMAAIEGGALGEDMKAAAATPPDPAAIKRLSASPYYNALLRMTCVATRLEGGHADNALPQTARATVNCRLLPGHAPEEAQRALVGLVADPRIEVSRPGGPAAAENDKVAPPSTIEPELLAALEKVAGAVWPGVPVVPTMETGGTDGYELRPAGIPTFGISGVFIDIDDVRAHGRDERVGVESFHEGVEFYHRLIKALSSQR
jgi:acetylornithine deacetylase/succinyl-diaminopimelate desuccinylase-like protein